MAISTAAAIVGGSIITGALGARSARKAGKAQQEGAEAGIAEQRRQFDITQQQFEPFRQAGVSALEQQRILLGLGGGAPVDPNQARREELQGQIGQIEQRGGGRFGPFQGLLEKARESKLAELQPQLGALPAAPTAQLSPQEQQAQAFAALNESPGQKFLRERGQRNLVRNAAAIGGLGGGNVREALVQQGVGFAQQDLQNQFARLGQLAGQGQAATTSVGQFGAQTSGNVANLLGQSAQARASGILGQNQALQQGIGGAFTGAVQGGLFNAPGQFNLPAANINPFARTA